MERERFNSDMREFVSEFNDFVNKVKSPFKHYIQALVEAFNDILLTFASFSGDKDKFGFFQMIKQSTDKIERVTLLMGREETTPDIDILPIIHVFRVAGKSIREDRFPSNDMHEQCLFMVQIVHALGGSLVGIKDKFQRLGSTAAVKLTEIANKLRDIQLHSEVDTDPMQREFNADIWSTIGRLTDVMEHL